MRTWTPWLRRALLTAVPVAAGIGLLALVISARTPPNHREPQEVARLVRVIQVTPTPFIPRALGHGHVEPGSVWSAVAEVRGTIVERHPDLETGKLLPAGTVILRIDPADYRLSLSEIEASLASVDAELGEVDVQRANAEASLEIERRAVGLAEDDLARKRTLAQRGNVSALAVDEAERLVLSARQRVQDLENQLRLIPARQRILETSRAVTAARREKAALDLARTVVRMPFDGRIAEVRVEVNQFVAAGSVLAVADSVDVAEVMAQVPLEQMASVLRRSDEARTLTAMELERFPTAFGLTAVVRLTAGSVDAEWRARVDRISPELDPKTRTVGVVVAVDEPYRQAVPGIRPPLVKNTFVAVEIFGRPWPESLVVPRAAVHRLAGAPVVYVADARDRLAIRPVRMGPQQRDLAVIEEGLERGERVIVSDAAPAVEGMLLMVEEDASLARRLIAEAEPPLAPIPTGNGEGAGPP